jgi:hypothetical protein
MTKKKADEIEVRLSCVYAGDGWSANPGDTVTVDAEEAERLIGLGVAKLVVDAPEEPAA